MSWNLKDTKSKHIIDADNQQEVAPPPQEHHDDEALPTVLAGMLDWETELDTDSELTLDQRRDLPDNWMSNREWKMWAMICRRGVSEVGDAPKMLGDND